MPCLNADCLHCRYYKAHEKQAKAKKARYMKKWFARHPGYQSPSAVAKKLKSIPINQRKSILKVLSK